MRGKNTPKSKAPALTTSRTRSGIQRFFADAASSASPARQPKMAAPASLSPSAARSAMPLSSPAAARVSSAPGPIAPGVPMTGGPASSPHPPAAARVSSSLTSLASAAAGTPMIPGPASSLIPAARPEQPLPCSLDSTPAIFRESSSPVSATAGVSGADILALRAHMDAMPTKLDMEGYVARLEAVCKTEIRALRSDLSSLSTTVHALEETVQVHSDTQAAHQLLLNQHSHQIQMLFDVAEDAENRNRRNNIRIRGLPEATRPPDLMPTLQGIFNTLLGNPPTEPLEIDRAHRALGPPSNDPARPRDVICRIHYFQIKEAIMRKARDRGPLDFDGAQIHLLQDLSRSTLAKRRSLRPLLQCLRDRGLTYAWGYPFQLLIRHGTHTLVFRSPADLPDLIEKLGLPRLSIPDWPAVPPLPQQFQRRRDNSSSSSRASPPRQRTRRDQHSSHRDSEG